MRQAKASQDKKKEKRGGKEKKHETKTFSNLGKRGRKKKELLNKSQEGIGDKTEDGGKNEAKKKWIRK